MTSVGVSCQSLNTFRGSTSDNCLSTVSPERLIRCINVVTV